MHRRPVQSRLDEAPISWHWFALACAVGTLWANWGWGRIASKASGQELLVLLVISLLAWPIAVVALSTALHAVLQRSPGAVRIASILGLVGLGLVLFGVPTLWNLAITAGMSIAAGIQGQRKAQDDTDLERL